MRGESVSVAVNRISLPVRSRKRLQNGAEFTSWVLDFQHKGIFYLPRIESQMLHK